MAVTPKSKVDKLFVRLVEYFDNNQTDTANALGCSQSHVWGYLSKTHKETLSPIIALRAELATDGQFQCEDLCPDLGDLIGTINRKRASAGKSGIGGV